jgi:hypothetical protein
LALALIGWSAAAVLLVAAAIFWLRTSSPRSEGSSLALTIVPPSGAQLEPIGGHSSAPQVSPDGPAVLYAANGALYVRHLDSFNATLVPGSEMSTNAPFWSADSGSVIYPAIGAGGLVKVRVPYGAPEMVMQLPGPTRGGSSNGNGTILVAGRRLYLLAAPGGRTETLDVPGLTKGAILYPEFLPAGDAALFLWLPGDGTGNEIYLASFKAGKLVDPVPLLKNDTAGVRAEEFASTITKENACYPFIHSIGTRERRLERQTRKVTDSNEPRAQELGHRRTERSRASDHSARRVVLPRFSS